MSNPKSNFHESLEGHIEKESGSNKEFGIVFGVVFSALSIYFAWIGFTLLASSTIMLALSFFLAAWSAPNLLTLPNRVWFKLSILLDKVVSPLILAILFFAIITPFGLCMRLFSPDPLNVKVDRSSKTYWDKTSDKKTKKQNMANQF